MVVLDITDDLRPTHETFKSSTSRVLCHEDQATKKPNHNIMRACNPPLQSTALLTTPPVKAAGVAETLILPVWLALGGS